MQSVAAPPNVSDKALRVLWVGDDVEGPCLIEESLQPLDDIHLHRETDLESGLSALSGDPFHVSILDIEPSEQCVISAIEAWTEAAPPVPVVVVSRTQELQPLRDAGASEVLYKDEVTPTLLSRTLRWAAERAQMEAKLSRCHTWIQSITENSPGGSFQSTDGRGIEYADEAFLSMFGYESLETLRGTDPKSLCVNPTEWAQMTRNGEPGGDIDRILELKRTDGSTFLGRLRSRTVCDERRGLTYRDGLITDVTDRVETEEELRQSREQLSRRTRMLNEVGQAVIATDADRQVTFWNDAAERVYGWAREDVLGRNILELTVPESAQGVADEIMEHLEQGEAWTGEFEARRKDGSTFPAIVSNAPLFDDGEIAGVIGVTTAITEQKAREQWLGRSRARLKALFDSSPDMIVIHDTEGRLIDPNPRLIEKTGYDEDELTDMKVWDIDKRANPDTARALWSQMDTGDRHTVNGLYQRKDGSTFPVEVHIRRLDLEGEDRFMAICRDVSQRKQREWQLEQIRENITDVVWMSTPDKASMEFISRSYEDVWGRSRRALKKSPTDFVDAIHPDDRERVLAALDVQRENPEAYEETYRVVQPGGEVRWVHDKAAGVYDEEGLLRRIVGVATDITDQKRREIAQRDRQEKIESLYTATSQLLTAEHREDVADRLHTVLQQVFDFLRTGVWLERDGTLVPARSVLADGQTEPSVDETRDVGGDSPTARAYRSGETVAEEHEPTDEGEGHLRSITAVPIGTHGVLRVERESRNGYDSFGLRLIEILAAHATTVLDRIEHEQTLQEERDLLERIFEISPTAIVLFNRDGDFVHASDRAEEVLGLEKEHITDRTYNDPEWDITTPDGRPVSEEELPFVRVISTEEPVYNVEHTIEWPNGTRRLLSVSGAPLRTSEGELEGAVFHVEDITAPRAAERALRESEERFRGVFENAAVGIAILDDSGRLLEINPALQKMTGYDEDELQGAHFSHVTHPDDIASDRKRYHELVAGQIDRYQMEKRYVRKGGDVFWGRLTVSRREGADEGQVVGMVEDIDDQKQYKLDLREAKAEAEEASRLKSAMLANMSHEIRTPLTSIIGFAELLAVRLEGEPADFADKIYRGSQRLMKMLDSVLELSNLEAKTVSLKRTTVRLDEVVEEAVELFRPRADGHSIALATSLPTAVKGEWNEGALFRIVENLLENAIKFTPDGGRVDVRVRQAGDAAVIEVEDTGIGIGDEALPYIFEAFKQESEGIDREYEGTGLGLSIVRRLVEAHGGIIDVETEKDEGTCFTIHLPLEAEGNIR